MDVSLSLGSIELCQWLMRLIAERDLGNLTRTHKEVGEYIARKVDAGEDQMRHADIARETRASVDAVKETLARLQILGLMEWDHQWNVFGGRRRQTMNRYRLSFPTPMQVARDMRRSTRRAQRRALTQPVQVVARPLPSEKGRKQEEGSWNRPVSQAVASLAAIRAAREASNAQRWHSNRLR